MGTILRFRATTRKVARKCARGSMGQIMIFPGIRIERHDLDLAHRLRDSVGRDDFGGIGGGRPRKTS